MYKLVNYSCEHLHSNYRLLGLVSFTGGSSIILLSVGRVIRSIGDGNRLLLRGRAVLLIGGFQRGCRL